MERFFCYAPQSQSIMGFLRSLEIVPVVMNAITEHYRMQGVEKIVFFTDAHHPRPVPREMMEFLEQRGAIMVEIDDTFRRRRYEART